MTKEKGLKIIELSQKGIEQLDIAKEIGCSQATISRFVRAYNGNQEQFSLLSETAKATINQINNKTIFPEYQCKLFFGLIKITFKPLYK